MIQIPLNGPPAKRRFACGPMMFQHVGSFWDFKVIRTSVAKEPYIFVIFQGGVRTPCPPPPPLRGFPGIGQSGHIFYRIGEQ